MIRNFDEIVQDLISENVEASAALKKDVVDTGANEAGPSVTKESKVHADDQ